jgi:predicted ester cyclase
MIADELRRRRLDLVEEHFRTEVTQEFELTLRTFNGQPHYEIMATGQVFDGDDEVMGYYRTTRTAFPDQPHDNVRLQVADGAVIAEFDLLGTNLGEFYGMPPTGKAFRVPVIAAERAGQAMSLETSSTSSSNQTVLPSPMRYVPQLSAISATNCRP